MGSEESCRGVTVEDERVLHRRNERNGMKYFEINVKKYVPGRSFDVFRPASLYFPKDHAVMFVTREYMRYVNALEVCTNCLVFWPEEAEVPAGINERHAVAACADPRTEYCRFYRDNGITYYPETEEYNLVNGAFISPKAVIGSGCRIFPGAYIGGDVRLGDHVYVGGGARLVGRIKVGNHVVIRENAVIGADGLSTNRDEEGRAVTMPQFGGVVIEDDVQIGALTVVARGAIDDTVIKRGSKIDNSCFISHNVMLGEDTFVVGESIVFGSATTGKQAYISGNCCVRDGVSVGEKALVGMGAVVVKPVPDGAVVKGNPAR